MSTTSSINGSRAGEVAGKYRAATRAASRAHTALAAYEQAMTQLGRDELRELAVLLGVKGCGRASKGQLVERLVSPNGK